MNELRVNLLFTVLCMWFSSVRYCRNVNPRDPLNINLRKAFLEYDKDL